MHQNKSIGIFTPYPFIIGGGERYIFTLAESFLLQGDKVTLLSPFPYDIKRISQQLGINLDNCLYKKTPTKVFFLPSAHKKYDYFFALSNHIYPPTFGQGKVNTLIVQFPFPYPTKKMGDKLQKLLLIPKLLSYQKILCYSEYSKKWIHKQLPSSIRDHLSIEILPPAVNIKTFSPLTRKKNIILSVGRFFIGDHNKNHLILIQAFKNLLERNNIHGWELHLAGYLHQDENSKQNYKKMEAYAKGLPIFFHPNISSEDLIKLYNNSKILWHAAGLGNDENKTPENSEHFGIVILEALAAGVIPIVVNAGGIPEIIKNNENGFLWNTQEELLMHTLNVLKNTNIVKIKVSKQFDTSEFIKRVHSLYA